jgi:hypothetical protein
MSLDHQIKQTSHGVCALVLKCFVYYIKDIGSKPSSTGEQADTKYHNGPGM